MNILIYFKNEDQIIFSIFQKKKPQFLEAF
jgi:hypothetical protein